MTKLLKMVRHAYRMLKYAIQDLRDHVEYCGFFRNNDSEVYWRLLLLAHSLEKGLSLPEMRADFGKEKAQSLMRFMVMAKNHDRFEYKEAASVLEKYYEFRKANKYQVDFADEALFSEQKIPVGPINIGKKDLLYNNKEFEKLCSIRHSVREFDDTPVSKSEVLKALEIARLAPSACNRQMIRVYFSEKRDINTDLAKIVPGNSGSEKECITYIFVAADRNAFDYYEIDQWYVNGGLFAAYFQLALTASNLGSCIYQWPKDKKLDCIAKKLLEIPESYQIVMAIGVGHYKDDFKVLESARKDLEEYFHCV